jgi:hypothetical protein
MPNNAFFPSRKPDSGQEIPSKKATLRVVRKGGQSFLALMVDEGGDPMERGFAARDGAT